MKSIIQTLKDEISYEIKDKKHRRHYVFILFLVPLLAIFLLCTIAMIPRDAIQKNMEESAEYINKRGVYKYLLIDSMASTTIDEVADANILNIAYFFTSDNPLISVITSKWRIEKNGYIQSFFEAVKEGKPPTSDYSRYWHGSLVFIRPLLVFLNIEQIYIINCIGISGLFCILLYKLLKNRLIQEGISFILSMVVTSLWIVPLCLEYIWMFLLTFIISIVTVELASKNRYSFFGCLCFLTGMITIFLDFFTTETLTITVPLFLALRIRIRQGKENEAFIFKCLVLWCFGYCIMWAVKWLIATVALGWDGLFTIIRSMYLHIEVQPGMNYFQFISETISRNISCLLPFDLGSIPSVVILILIVFLVFVLKCMNMIYLKKPSHHFYIYLIMGVIPYLRFFILAHHSWAHYFFTYRAQVVTILALFFIVMEFIGVKPLQYKEGIWDEE